LILQKYLQNIYIAQDIILKRYKNIADGNLPQNCRLDHELFE